MTTVRAYAVDQQGLVEIITVLLQDGELTDMSGWPIVDTGLRETLVGWPDRHVRVCRNSGGLEILVPLS